MSETTKNPTSYFSLFALSVLSLAVAKFFFRPARRRVFPSLSPAVVERLASIEAIFLDLDGTLVSTERLWFELTDACCRHFGCPPLTFSSYLPYFGQSLACDIEIFFQNRVNAEEIKQYCHDHLMDYLPCIQPMNGLKEFLSSVEDLFPRNRAIITNCPPEIAEIEMKHTGIRESLESTLLIYYGEVENSLNPISSSSSTEENRRVVFPPKPSPEMILTAVKELNISNVSNVLFIGDSRYDVQAARAAGCLSVALGRSVCGDGKIQLKEKMKEDPDKADIELPELIDCLQLMEIIKKARSSSSSCSSPSSSAVYPAGD